MRVKKCVSGSFDSVELELEKIQDYGRYCLYQVYKVDGDKLTPLYKTAYTDEQIKDIILKGYRIVEEEFE